MMAHRIRKGFTSEQAEAVAEMLEVDLAGKGSSSRPSVAAWWSNSSMGAATPART